MIIIPKLNFPKYYGCLFRGVESALNAIQKQNYVQAQDILIKAQQEAEDLFLSDTDEQRECMREQQRIWGDIPEQSVLFEMPVDEGDRFLDDARGAETMEI